MKLAGCFDGINTSYMSKHQDKFDFSYHDPFKAYCIFPLSFSAFFLYIYSLLYIKKMLL